MVVNSLGLDISMNSFYCFQGAKDLSDISMK